MRSGRAAIAFATFATLLGSGGRARAWSLERQDSVEVEVEAGEPGAAVRISGRGVDVPCGPRCDAHLEPGEYRLQITLPGGRASARNILIDGPSRLIVTPHNQTARVTGIVLMPIGIAGVGAGLVMLWWAGFKLFAARLAGCDGDCSAEIPSWLVPAGVAALGGGIVVGLTGLVIWRATAHAGVRVEPLTAPRASRPQWRVRPAAGLHWTGLALSGSF